MVVLDEKQFMALSDEEANVLEDFEELLNYFKKNLSRMTDISLEEFEAFEKTYYKILFYCRLF